MEEAFLPHQVDRPPPHQTLEHSGRPVKVTASNRTAVSRRAMAVNIADSAIERYRLAGGWTADGL